MICVMQMRTRTTMMGISRWVRMVEAMTGITTMTTIALPPSLPLVDLDDLEALHTSDIEGDADFRVESDVEMGKDDEGHVEMDVDQQ